MEHDVKLIGLSALMTTTVVNMEEAIRLIRIKKPDAKVGEAGIFGKEQKQSHLSRRG